MISYVHMNIFFPQRTHFFPIKSAFPQTPSLSPHLTVQSLGYVMKCAAACRVFPPVY